MNGTVAPDAVLELVERMLGASVKDRSYELTRSGSDVSDYLSFKKNEENGEASSVESRERDLARLVTFKATKTPGDFTIDDLRACRDTYPEGSRRRVTAAYRDFFRWLYEEGRTPANAAGRLRYPKRKTPPITDLFTEEERAAIVTAQTSIRDRACVLLLLRAGLRKGELRKLQVRDVNLAEMYVLVRFGKGSKSRRVPIRGALVRALDEFLLTELPGLGRTPRGSDYILYPARGRNQNVEDGVATPDRKMAQSTAHRWWYRCLHRAGIVEPGLWRGRRAHSARHTYATDLGRATNWNMVAVQKNLGHSQISTTIDIYTTFAFEDQAAAADMLAARDEA
ncbi:MAG: tyrosine-type recombinase/integrase [Gemmatimonadaceae bacterium]|nr:tyrosine-type recombinase/integrase [Gemmatimonadaceae bacterium]